MQLLDSSLNTRISPFRKWKRYSELVFGFPFCFRFVYPSDALGALRGVAFVFSRVSFLWMKGDWLCYLCSPPNGFPFRLSHYSFFYTPPLWRYS